MKMMLPEEQAVNAESAVSMLEFTEAFIGNVDLIREHSLAGWVAYKDDPERDVKVGLWIGSRCIVELIADAYRADLESIRSDGRCSFEIAFPSMLALVASETLQTVRLIVSTDTVQSVLLADVFKESTETSSENARERTKEAFWLAHILQGVDDEEERPASEVNANSNCPSASNEFVSLIHSSHPDISPTARSSVPFDPEVPELSRYVRYTLERLKLDSQFRIDENPWDATEALFWYIEGYGSTRKPLRIPLSKKEISYCNTMLFFPGCRFQMSRAHYFHLLKHRPGFAPADILNDESAYNEEIYNWVCEISVDLNMSDVLVPKDYIDTLKQLRSQSKDRRFAFNSYFEIRRHRESSWRVFAIDSAVERGLMYLVAWLESGGKPACVQFMSERVNKELFEIKNIDGLTFFEQTALDLLEDSSLQDIRKLYDSITHSQRNILLEAGYDVDKMRYTTCDTQGNRRHLPKRVMQQDADSPIDLQLIGPFRSASGLGQATRLSVLAMRAAGLEPHLVNFDLDNPAPTGFSSAMKSGLPKQAKVNLVHLNAEAAPFAAAYLPDFFSNSYNIGYFFWELDSPAKCHSLALEMFDEIWVSTEYGFQQYNTSMDNPVINVGMTYEEIETPSKEDSRARLNETFNIDADETVFLTTFDSFSFVQRKNPKAVIQSFLEAFPGGNERVRLIVKTQNRDSVLDPVQQKIWKSIDNLISLDSRIMFVNKTMKYSDLLWFKKAADCYVSLHRSEGWGFGMIESMMLDVPVIATGYSGNLEFCKEEHCWLVETDEIYLNHDDYIFVMPGQKWGEPRVSAAAACMKDAYKNKRLRIQKAQAAREYVQENFSPSVIGQRYVNRLKAIDEIIESKNSIAKAA